MLFPGVSNALLSNQAGMQMLSYGFSVLQVMLCAGSSSLTVPMAAVLCKHASKGRS